MAKLIASTSVKSLGCTFLDWTINYLSGVEQIFNAKHGWVKLTDNPVTAINAHGHLKNRPMGLAQLKAQTAILEANSEFITMYPEHIRYVDAARELNINIDNVSVDDQARITQYCQDDYKNVLEWLSNRGAKIIFVSLPESLVLYNFNIRNIEISFNDYYEPKDKEEFVEGIESVFFDNSITKWGENASTNIWDIRERKALDYRPFKSFNWDIDFSIDHYWLDCQQLFFGGEQKISEIMRYLELEIVESRLPHWKSVYEQWQQIQIKHLNFCYEHQHIVDSIINNWDFNINLTFEQEVVIQHSLIYQHNLNLKTWQLEKFPSNTKLLHSLLEPNIHPLKY